MLTIIKADKQNYAHTHTPRQTHTHIYIERGKHLHFLTVEKGRFSSQHRSSLSNPSVAEKEPSQPFLLNPLPSKSSARPRLRHTHSCFCHLRGHRFDSFLTLKDRFAQITQKKLDGFFYPLRFFLLNCCCANIGWEAGTPWAGCQFIMRLIQATIHSHGAIVKVKVKAIHVFSAIKWNSR